MGLFSFLQTMILLDNMQSLLNIQQLYHLLLICVHILPMFNQYTPHHHRPRLQVQVLLMVLPTIIINGTANQQHRVRCQILMLCPTWMSAITPPSSHHQATVLINPPWHLSCHEGQSGLMLISQDLALMCIHSFPVKGKATLLT